MVVYFEFLTKRKKQKTIHDLEFEPGYKKEKERKRKRKRKREPTSKSFKEKQMFSSRTMYQNFINTVRCAEKADNSSVPEVYLCFVSLNKTMQEIHNKARTIPTSKAADKPRRNHVGKYTTLAKCFGIGRQGENPTVKQAAFCHSTTTISCTRYEQLRNEGKTRTLAQYTNQSVNTPSRQQSQSHLFIRINTTSRSPTL